MQHFLSFLYLLTPTDEFLFEVEYYTANNLHLTTNPVELGFIWHIEVLKLKTCSLYHEKLLVQKFKVIISQVLDNFFSASDIMEAVRGRFRFYGMNVI